MEALTFKLEDFEGPLDLLLYLVSKNKMNLYDINIMQLIDQYTAVINTLQADRMDVASEFIDMAAKLVQMKSALLLPRSPEAERMKAELTGRLIEYSTCKAVAAQLGSRARDVLRRCASLSRWWVRRNTPAGMTRNGWYRPGTI